jgi:hypothetical protein
LIVLSENVLPEQAGGVQFGDGGVHDADRIRILRADVEHADFRAGEPCRDHHAEQHRVRALLHEILVDVSAGVALVGVADDILHRARGRSARRPFEMQREACAAASTQAGILEFAPEPVAIFFQQRAERFVVFLHARKWRRELRGLQMRNDLVAILGVAFARGKKRLQRRIRLPRVILSIKLKRPALVTPPKTADVPDFLVLETPAERIVQLLLRPRAETRRAVADEHLLPRVFLFQEVIKRHCPQRQRIAKQ